MSLAVLFPGQGSQFVGMSEDVFSARPDLLVDHADAILGWSMRDLCQSGPAEVMTDTRHAQPLLFAISYAMWEAARQHLPEPSFFAGHSLGEYTALAAAGMLSFDHGLRLVAARGDAMAAAAAAVESGMAAVLGADEETVRQMVAACNAQGGTLTLANINSPSELVVAGSQADIAWVQERARDLGARRIISLKVAGAFHTEYMNPAVAPFTAAVGEAEFNDGHTPVVGNTNAIPIDSSSVRDTLTRQLVEPVRFTDGLRYMAERGVTDFLHLGPGNVTAGMAKRTLPEVEIHTISHLSDIPHVAEAVGHLR